MENTPIYIEPANSPTVLRYAEIFDFFEKPENNSLSLSVYEELVKNGDVAMIQELIVALQHYPHLIEKFILAIDFQFEEIKDSEIYYPPEYWKYETDYYKWFYQMANLPNILFFIRDEDARFYFLARDFLSDQSVNVTERDKAGRATIEFTNEQAQELANRIFNACWFMLIFCHGSGFNPKPFIEAMIANYEFDINYDDVYNAYKTDVEKGIKLQARSVHSNDE